MDCNQNSGDGPRRDGPERDTPKLVPVRPVPAFLKKAGIHASLADKIERPKKRGRGRVKFIEDLQVKEKELKKIQRHLNLVPHDWEAYQGQTREILDAIFQACFELEKANAEKEDEIYRSKRRFQDFIYTYLQLGDASRMMLEKPFGYQGDFLLMDNIYYNQSRIIGFERVIDEYFLNSPACQAMRHRKDAFRKSLREFTEERKDVLILKMGCGPCRDVREFYHDIAGTDLKVQIDCTDQDLHILDYAKELVSGVLTDRLQVRWRQENIIRFALAQVAPHSVRGPYDMVYSLSVLDNLDDKVAMRLIRNLRTMLHPGGLLALASFREKEHNPSRHLMEWGGGWDVMYRSEETFRELFIKAGFAPDYINIQSDELGIIQLALVTG